MNRLEAIHELPCVACEIERAFALVRKETPLSQPNRTEAHHLVDRGNREASGGHDATIPLCSWHHRGEPKMYLKCSEMDQLYGPSMARNKRAFRDLYGSERDLLAVTDERLKTRDVA